MRQAKCIEHFQSLRLKVSDLVTADLVSLTLHWPMATKVPLIKFAKRTPSQVS